MVFGVVMLCEAMLDYEASMITLSCLNSSGSILNSEWKCNHLGDPGSLFGLQRKVVISNLDFLSSSR